MLLQSLLRLPNYLFIYMIRFYQIALSPLLPRTCRFEPSCSHYGLQALRQYNILKAIYLTIRRIVRCHPFNPGGYDPLP